MSLIVDGHAIETVIFDLGGVLVDWDPRYLYEKVFVSKDAMEYFLDNICTMEWNEQQDAGRAWTDGIDKLVNEFPHYKYEISAYFNRWEEMLKGEISESVDSLHRLYSEGIPLFALTNWSKETFPLALERFEFLSLFEGILVSGEEGMKKPDLSIFKLCCERYAIDPRKALFIDDNLRNVEAAKAFGLRSIHFSSASNLKQVLGFQED